MEHKKRPEKTAAQAVDFQAVDGNGRRQGEMVERLRESNRAFSEKNAKRTGRPGALHAWKRQTWTLPREEARQKALEFLRKYPRAAYWSEVESWRVVEDDIIEFTMRRLPTAD